jgi:hypothetical protein
MQPIAFLVGERRPAVLFCPLKWLLLSSDQKTRSEQIFPFGSVQTVRWSTEQQRRLGSMPKFVIERDIPGVGKLSPAELQGISQKSCSVLKNMGPQIQWVQSYVTDDKIYCVYIAPSEEAVYEHARQGGFPANRVSQVRSAIDPTTGE